MTISRRCLICANINPCRRHTDDEQIAELRRNDAEIAAERDALRNLLESIAAMQALRFGDATATHLSLSALCESARALLEGSKP